MKDRPFQVDERIMHQPIPAMAPAAPGLPPAQPLPYAGAAAGFDYADIGQRLLAWMIDAALLGVVRVVFIIAMSLVAAGVDGTQYDTDNVKIAFAVAFFAGLYLCAWPYYMFLEASAWQATVGKRALGIRVEDVEGGRATRVQTSVRFFLRLVSALTLGIGFLVCGFTRRRQTLHDVAANCVVTRSPRTPYPFPAPQPHALPVPPAPPHE